MIKEKINALLRQGGEHMIFVFATIFSAGIHFLYSIFAKKYVLPYEYGIFSSCTILQTYLAYLQLGILNAFNRDYPQLIGANDAEGAKKYRDTAFSFLILTYVISFAVLAVIIKIIGTTSTLDSRYTWGLILCAAIAATTIFENMGSYRTRIDKGFKYVSVVMFIELISILLGVVLIPILGYYVLYLSTLMGMLIGIICYIKPAYSDIRFKIERKLLKTILVSGLPLLINGLIWTIVNTIDKFVILGFIDTEALGLYGIAQNAFSYMVLIPSAMSQLFYVKMGKSFGANKSVASLNEMAGRFTVILAALTSVIAIIAFYGLPWLVDWIMPSYEPGVPAAQILIVGLSIYAATLVNNNILTILRKNGALLRTSIYMCVFDATFSILFVKVLGNVIESVALGTAVSYIFCAFVIMYQVRKSADCKISKLIKASVVPICFTIIPGVIVYQLPISKILALVIALAITICFYLLFYKKEIRMFLKREE